MSNWSAPTSFRLFSESAPKSLAPPQPLPPRDPPKDLSRNPLRDLPKERPKVEAKLKTRAPSDLDAMLQSIDADVALCDKTARPLRIALKAPAHPVYDRLRAAIAAHIGEITDEETADLVLAPQGGDIELLAPEDYTPEKKRALWDELKKRAHRR